MRGLLARKFGKQASLADIEQGKAIEPFSAQFISLHSHRVANLHKSHHVVALPFLHSESARTVAD